MFTEKAKYEIGQEVFHALPDGERGLVMDIRYHFLHKYYEYLVTFGVGRTAWFMESELSATRKY